MSDFVRRNAPKASQEAPPARLRNVWFLVLAPLAVALAGAGVFFVYHKNKSEAAKPALTAASPMEIATGAEVSFTGMVQARNMVLVETPIEGTVETVEVEPGSEVSEGQILARIKNEGVQSSFEAAREDLDRTQNRINNLESSIIAARLEVSRSQADSERARIEYDRVERAASRQSMLFKEGATARLTYEKAQSEFAAARAEYDGLRDVARKSEDRVTALSKDLDAVKKTLEEKQKSLEGANADLALAEVHSPVDGVVVGMKAKVGEEVELGVGDLFEIAVELGELQIAFAPDPKTSEKLKDGLPATVQLLELSRDGVSGEVRKTPTGDWRVYFASPDPAVKPGINAIIKIKLN